MARAGKRKRGKVAPSFGPDFLGKQDPPPGWLRLNEGKELTVDERGYWVDPGHLRKGRHLVIIGGELYEVARAENQPTGQAVTETA